MTLVEAITSAVNQYWADQVQIVGIWGDTPTMAYIVYARRDDRSRHLLARVASVTPYTADGTVTGVAADVALNLAEPPGAAFSAARQDEHGIYWLGFRLANATPDLPAEVRTAVERFRSPRDSPDSPTPTRIGRPPTNDCRPL